MGCQRSEPADAPRLALLTAAAEALAVPLDRRALDRFQRYFELLREHGSRYNLTSVLDYEGVQQRHFVESLAVGAALVREGLIARTDDRNEGRSETIIDIGAGAGFPGLPLAIAWPGLRLTLLEATGKKADFIALVIRELALDHTAVANARAEDAAHRPDLREQFDLALARAVAPLAILAELTLPFVRVGGAIGAIKGSRLDTELAEALGAIRICGGGSPREVDLNLRAASVPPRLLLVSKRRATPHELPRPPGLPSRAPLR